MSKKYNIICIDPPWGNFKDKLKMSDVKRGAGSNYSTMTTEQIKNIPIYDLVDTSAAVLALWVPSSILQDGLDVMKAYNFTCKQTWIWVKTKNDPLKNLEKLLVKKLKDNKKIMSDKSVIQNSIKEFMSKTDWYNQMFKFGLGRISRNIHEIALIGTCGKINSKIKNRKQRTVFLDKNYKHSQKTEILQDQLDIIFPDSSLNRLEVFGRRLRDNYEVIGNESPSCLGEDILDSINRLKQ